MNIQHESRSDQWGTPPEVLALVRGVLGQIELDPCSSARFNLNVQAKRYFSENAFEEYWSAESVFVNPPGGKTGNRSKAGLFWGYLQSHMHVCGHAIWMGFSLEQLQVTQAYGGRSMLNYPLCVPRKRIAFLKPDGTPGKAPSHSNVIVYLPGQIDRSATFREVFSALGACS